MDLVLLRLTPPTPAADSALPVGTVPDILWANAVPADRLEHVRARAGPAPGTIDLALFLRSEPHPKSPDTASGTYAAAVRLCRRAVAAAPVLRGWTVTGLSGSLLLTIDLITDPNCS